MNEETLVREDTELLELVGFKLGEEEFGIDIINVNEIIKMQKITSIPNAPSDILGIVNIRGKIIAVVDTRLKLGTYPKEFNNETRIIILEFNKKPIGFIVDEVTEVLRISKKTLNDVPDMVSTKMNTDYIKSIANIEDKIIILLDLQKLLSGVNF
ncbi:MAG: purine-binding chemotaxis protein CheW [Ignavibacteriales bacterium]|nr:purine-binding chemotaxis protein CheW [Ignavibacteriales bacterium]